jgi:hypothetical protein
VDASIIYDAIRDWQTLIACVVVLAAIQYYHFATVRVVKRKADALARAMLHTLDISSGALRKEIADLMARPVPQFPAKSETHVAQSGAATNSVTRARLDALRRSLRAALGELSVSGGVGKGRVSELYAKVASFDFTDLKSEMFAQSAGNTLGKLQDALAGLKTQTVEEMGVRRMWDALVHINRLARQLEAELEGHARTSAVPVAVAKAE